MIPWSGRLDPPNSSPIDPVVWQTRPMRVLAELLAHQGGWDEILMVVAPLAMLAGLLFLANRRASRNGRRPSSRDQKTSTG